MAMRILVFLVCCGLMAKEVPRTMTTRRVVSAKAFSERRAKALESMTKKKRWSKNGRTPKSQWGAVKVRPKG